MPLRLTHTLPHVLQAISQPRRDPIPIIEDFLYEQQVLLLSSDPGVGKSVLSTQAFLSLVSGQPLFAHLWVPKPRRVAYLQLEGNYDEYVDRMALMLKVIPCTTGEALWDECRVFETQSPVFLKETLTILTPLRPEVVIIDPLYRLTMKPIASEEGSKSILRFLDLLQAEFQCAIWLNHHTHRQKYHNGQTVEEGDAYFGSQWLKAYVNTSYTIKRTSPNTVGLFNKKSRGSDTFQELLLKFDPETFTCYVEKALDAMSGEEKVIAWYRQCLHRGKTTTDFYEVLTTAQLSHAHLRRIQMRHLKHGLIKCDKVLNRRKIWEIQSASVV